MRASRLHRLAKVLREVALDATHDPDEERIPAHELAVVEFVAYHPGSSIKEIAAGTQIAQSMVSGAVAHLSRRELLRTGKDPHDGRRSLVWVTDEVRAKFPGRGSRDLDQALRAALPWLDQAQVLRVEGLLEELAALLLPPDRR